MPVRDLILSQDPALALQELKFQWTELAGEMAGIQSGTYTPTLTNVSNVAASTAYACQWLQVGRVVSVSGRVDVDPTLTATSTQLGISLPQKITSNFIATTDCSGSASASGVASQSAAILADVTNNRAQMQWVSGDVTNQAMYFVFMFVIK